MTPELPPPSPALLQRLASLAPVRTRRPLVEVAMVAMASLAAMTALLVASGVRLDARTLGVVSGSLGCALGFAVLLWWALVPPRGQVLPLRPASGRRLLVVWALMVGALLLAGHDSALEPARLFLSRSRSCLVFGSAAAMVPALLTLLFLRRALETGGWRLGLAVGGAAGALGGLCLELHCGNPYVAHIVVAHGGAILLPAALGALLVRK